MLHAWILSALIAIAIVFQTAQVASQQGKYLGKKLKNLAKQHSTLAANDLFDDDDSTYDKPFSYRHLGSLAYIGNAVRIPSDSRA